MKSFPRTSFPRASPYRGDSGSPPRVANFSELRQREVRRINLPRTPVNRVWWAKVIFGGIRLGPRVHHRLCGIPALLPVRLEVRLFGFLPVFMTRYDLS